MSNNKAIIKTITLGTIPDFEFVEYDKIVEGCTTIMERTFKTRDDCGNKINPITQVKIKQGNNVVVLDRRQLEIALIKWFNNGEIDEP